VRKSKVQLPRSQGQQVLQRVLRDGKGDLQLRSFRLRNVRNAVRFGEGLTRLTRAYSLRLSSAGS